MTMQAFHNDPAVKAKYVQRVKMHAAADELISGTGWENGRGCAIGCTLDAYDHSRYPIELGLPEWLAHLEDTIFENLSKGRAQRWPSDLLEAIRPGAVIDDTLRDELAARRLKRLLPALVANREPYARECETALRNCIVFLRGKDKSKSAESAARSAARSAESAESAAWSARSAAWSAESAAESAARSAAWEWEADTLLELLRAA